jgi:hypothetical protein
LRRQHRLGYVAQATDLARLRAEVVGIGRGIATTLALSTGEQLTLPASLDRLEKRRRQA